jgi:hypothetical protein
MLTMVAGWLSTAKPRHCATTSFSWLSIYFALNLALTIYNKLVLVGGFPFPYTLTAIHCLFGTAGSYVCLQRGVFVQAKLSSEETLLIFLFSWLYAVNIIVSNVSLYASLLEVVNAVDTLLPCHSIKLFGRRLLFLSLSYRQRSTQKPILGRLICL